MNVVFNLLRGKSVGKINQLDFQVANLIAAGEVVERPASAVKELLENAIDAEATEITVEIKRGGITFIRVSDNGCGMSADDLPISIRRHATSKISCASDLDGITTLGFRGEALAAISSVSTMRIMTKRECDSLGSLLCSENGKITDLSEVGCRNGTTVIVEDLFANVPARRKFLKKDQSEAMAVAAVVEKIALSRPDISFKLIIDGNIKFCTAGDSKIISAVYEILGRDFASKLIEVDSMTDGIEVNGYIGRPDNVRANRNYQNFFINGRYVRSKTATAALEQAFESYIEVGKFPCAVLYIYIHPTFVDVNVHPTKMEVKFSNERIVFDSIFCAVRNALMQATERPQVMFDPCQITDEQRSIYNAFVPVYDKISDAKAKELTQTQIFDTSTDSDITEDLSGGEKKSGESAADFYKMISEATPPLPSDDDAPPERYSREYKSEKNPENRQSAEKLDLNSLYSGCFDNSRDDRNSGFVSDFGFDGGVTIEENKKADTKNIAENNPSASEGKYSFSLTAPVDSSSAADDFRIIGVAFRTYIFVETNGKVMIIDKHAAHERILFEQMKKNMQAQNVKNSGSQLLLIPIELRLTPEECDAAEAYREKIEKAGFLFEIDEKQIKITAIPSILDGERAKTMMETLTGRLAEGTGDIESTKDSFFEEALYQGSCKAAIKAGQYDTDENMEWVVRTLKSIPEIICCPHGRPVAIELSKHEIEHLFKRI